MDPITLISNNNPPTSSLLRKKSKNDIVPNNTVNRINKNSHDTMIMNINTVPIVNQHQQVQQQQDHQQSFFSTIVQQISKKNNVSLTSYIVRSPYSERDELINNVAHVGDDTVSTSINISPLHLRLNLLFLTIIYHQRQDIHHLSIYCQFV